MPTRHADALELALLSAHHLVFQVQALLERAQSHVVLVTPYVDLWPSLELVMRQTVHAA